MSEAAEGARRAEDVARVVEGLAVARVVQGSGEAEEATGVVGVSQLRPALFPHCPALLTFTLPGTQYRQVKGLNVNFKRKNLLILDWCHCCVGGGWLK